MHISQSDFKVAVFDLDGTVYNGNSLVEGADKVISHFRRIGKKVFFLTNNSTKTVHQICDKLQRLGIECSVDEIVTSVYVAAKLVTKLSLQNIFLFGSENLKKEMERFGVVGVNIQDAENLLIGYNPSMQYVDLADAIEVALKAKNILACNMEKLFPSDNGRLMPGCGAMVAPIEFCSGHKVDYVIGKPNPAMLSEVCELAGTNLSDVIMIGDSYESDIAMSNRAGIKSVYISKEIRPDTICVNSISSILNAIM